LTIEVRVKETLIADEEIFGSMQEHYTSYDFDKLERLRKNISNKLAEANRSASSEKIIKDLQKRAVMQLQQFYKILLSDYSPTEVKHMKLYLKHNGFPDLREALRLKPAKITEKLKPPLERLECDPGRKKQLQGGIDRIEETVNVLDKEIFNYSSFSKKEQQMIERLEEINRMIETVLYLRKKIVDLRMEMETYVQKIPKPEGSLDLEAVVSKRHEDRKEELSRMLRNCEDELSSTVDEEMGAMEKLKNFLHSSGTLLDSVVKVMPRIREMTSSVVKSGSNEVTEWDVSVAVSRLDKFTSDLSDDDPLKLLGNERILDALHYIHDNGESLRDYNSVLRVRDRRKILEDDITRLKESMESFEKDESVRKERELIQQEAAKNLETFGQIRQELERSMEELDAEMKELGAGADDASSPGLGDEVEKILDKL
jgi:hypothetical protein